MRLVQYLGRPLALSPSQYSTLQSNMCTHVREPWQCNHAWRTCFRPGEKIFCPNVQPYAFLFTQPVDISFCKHNPHFGAAQTICSFCAPRSHKSHLVLHLFFRKSPFGGSELRQLLLHWPRGLYHHRTSSLNENREMLDQFLIGHSNSCVMIRTYRFRFAA